jgi:hypothetical protein
MDCPKCGHRFKIPAARQAAIAELIRAIESGKRDSRYDDLIAAIATASELKCVPLDLAAMLASAGYAPYAVDEIVVQAKRLQSNRARKHGVIMFLCGVAWLVAGAAINGLIYLTLGVISLTLCLFALVGILLVVVGLASVISGRKPTPKEA